MSWNQNSVCVYKGAPGQGTSSKSGGRLLDQHHGRICVCDILSSVCLSVFLLSGRVSEVPIRSCAGLPSGAPQPASEQAITCTIEALGGSAVEILFGVELGTGPEPDLGACPATYNVLTMPLPADLSNPDGYNVTCSAEGVVIDASTVTGGYTLAAFSFWGVSS